MLVTGIPGSSSWSKVLGILQSKVLGSNQQRRRRKVFGKKPGRVLGKVPGKKLGRVPGKKPGRKLGKVPDRKSGRVLGSIAMRERFCTALGSIWQGMGTCSSSLGTGRMLLGRKVMPLVLRNQLPGLRLNDFDKQN